MEEHGTEEEEVYTRVILYKSQTRRHSRQQQAAPIQNKNKYKNTKLPQAFVWRHIICKYEKLFKLKKRRKKKKLDRSLS